MHPLKQKQTIHLEKRGHQDLADKVNEIVDYINSKEKPEDKKLEKRYFESPRLEIGRIITEEMTGWESTKDVKKKEFCKLVDRLVKSMQTEKEYAGATLLGLIEHFEDLEEDGANIPPYIYRNIRKFGKKNNLPPFNNK